MILFWLAAFVPIVVGGLLWIFGNQVNWREWVWSTVIALIMAVIFQITATIGMTTDIETWSGYVTHARQFSAWKEYYEEAIYRTESHLVPKTHVDADGDVSVSLEWEDHRVFDHWEGRERWHGESWRVYSTLGDWDISQGTFEYLRKQYGGIRRLCPFGESMADN